MTDAETKFQRYRKNQESKGLKQTSVWVPEADIEAVKKYAEKKRRAFFKEQAA